MLALLFAFPVLLSLAACGDKATDTADNGDQEETLKVSTSWTLHQPVSREMGSFYRDM